MADSFDVSIWLSALTLKERIILSKDPSHIIDTKCNLNKNLADFRYETLRSQTAFESESLFNKRLKVDNLTRESLIHLFGESSECLAARFEDYPDYALKLKEILDSGTQTNKFLQSYVKSSNNKLSGFLLFSATFVEYALNRLGKQVNEISKTAENFPFTAVDTNHLFLPLLIEHLTAITYRVLTLELNVARVTGSLKGDSPEARFEDFLSTFNSIETIVDISSEYSVMSRRIIESIDDWLGSSLEFVKALCNDWKDICSTFNVDKAEIVAKIIRGTSDFHKRGRTVLIIQFSSEKKLVFKPRSLSIDVNFSALLTDLNNLGVDPAFRILKVLDRTNHGWNEFIEDTPCSTLEEVKRFYQRQGFYLALLYVMVGEDFHAGNVIASGEHPMLVDVEMLFQPQTKTDNATFFDNQLAYHAIINSVLKIGILPQKAFGDGNSEGIDIGGLTGASNQLTPMKVGVWDSIGEDTTQVNYKQVLMDGNNNRVKFGNAEIDVRDHFDELINGFTHMYNLLLSNREKLIATDGYLHRFVKDQIRILFRTSQAYSLILKDSYHPDVLRDAIDRDILFDRLWLGVARNSHLEAIINAEKTDLHQGDIPIFNVEVGSKLIQTSSGEHIGNLLEYSGFESVKNRLKKIGKKDLEIQKWFINSSMSALNSGIGIESWASYKFKYSESTFSQSDFLSEAEKIGDRILELALQNSDYADWLELTLVNEKSWQVLPMGIDLYSGLSGVALFLAYLGLVSQKDDYTKLAKKTVNNILYRTNDLRNDDKNSFQGNIGAFNGLSGIVYLLTHLGSIWNDSSLLKEADLIGQVVQKYINHDANFDIIGGMPGCIISFLNLYSVSNSEIALGIAVACGEHLVNNLTITDNNIKWHSNHGISRGFSHGAEGIAASLFALSKESKKEIFKDIAQKVVDQELRSTSNYKELNNPKKEDVLNFTWCHGISGIGLGKLFAARRGDINLNSEEIDKYLQIIIKNGFGLNHSMCHGDTGNLDFLIEANKYLPTSDFTSLTKKVADGVLDSIKELGWLCGVPNGIETPGFMVGLSGIGYGLLRVANPEIVPSILSLSPPVNNIHK